MIKNEIELLDYYRYDIVSLYKCNFSIKYIINWVEKKVNTYIRGTSKNGGIWYMYVSDKNIERSKIAQYVYNVLIDECIYN